MSAEHRTSLEDIRRWRADYREGLGPSPLDDIAKLPARMDVTHAHPSGIAQLFASGRAPLASLFRDPGTLRAAGRRLERVLDDCAAKERVGGISQVSLVVGVASWKGNSVPVLLYPVDVTRDAKGDCTDAVVSIVGPATLNHSFVSLMRQEHVDLDEDEVLGAARYGKNGPQTSAVFDSIVEAVGTTIVDFDVERHIILGCFMDASALYLSESRRLIESMSSGGTGNTVLDALSGDSDSVAALAGPALPNYSPFDADPHGEFAAGDVDNVIRYAADVAASGRSIMIDSADGSDTALQSAAIASRCVAEGRTVLYVSGVTERRRRFRRVMDRLDLGGLVLDLGGENLGREIDQQLIAAVGFQEGKATANFNRLADELVGVRSRLTRYLGDLHGTSNKWGISAYETMEHLAAVAALPSHPSTRVRLSPACAVALSGHLDEWSRRLSRAGELGEYRIGPDDTPWFGASVESEDQAVAVYRRVDDLLRITLPTMRAQIASTVQACGFPVPQTADEWGRQVTVLKNLRLVLNVFQPQIFERDIEAMIEATKPKEVRKAEGTTMGFWERRRRTKEAKGLLRAGAQIESLHKALIVVAKQARQWRELVPHGGWPVLPGKLDSIVAQADELSSGLTSLGSVLATTPAGGDLGSLTFVELEERLKSLHADQHALDTLPGRWALEREFETVGLSELVADLRERGIEPDVADGELRLSWWTTVFEDIVRSSAVISNQDGMAMQSASDRFAQVDAEHVQSIGPMVRQESVRRLCDLLFSHTKEANQLHTVLAGAGHVPFSTFRSGHPQMVSAAKPVLVATPATLVATTGLGPIADLVIVDAGAHMPSLELLSVLSRARQVVVVAHSATVTSPATLALMSLLPSVACAGHASCRDPRLSRFLEEHGYGELRHDPVCETSRGTVRLHRVEATGAPAMSTGLVESSQPEVDEVVRLITQRAKSFTVIPPGYVLTVVTLTTAFRDRLGAELKTLATRDKARTRFLRHVRIVDISEVCGSMGDDVILSLCYAKTAHGRLLQQFGSLEGDHGDRLLLDACALARRDLDITAAFGSEDLDESRLHQPGPRLLRRLLEWGESLTGDVDEAGPVVHPGEGNVLLADLAARLTARGVSAGVDYGCSGGMRIPLVVGLPGGRYTVAVMTDDAAFMGVQSTRVRHRTIIRELESLGWSVITVWSVAAFVNPDKEVDRIITRLGEVSGRESSGSR